MYELTTATANTNYWLAPVLLRKEEKGEILITTKDVMDATCRVFNITKPALVSKKRSRELVRARNISMYVMREKVKMFTKKKKVKSISFKQIGNSFNRDHTTAIHGIDQIESDLSVPAYCQETNEQIRAVIELL